MPQEYRGEHFPAVGCLPLKSPRRQNRNLSQWRVKLSLRRIMATVTSEAPANTASINEKDWSKPKAMGIPKDGYFALENGRYGPVYPRTPACHGFTIIAKIKPGREDVIRA